MPALGLDNNWRILKTVLDAYADLVAIEFTLRREGDDAAADQLSGRIRKLEKRIRKLRAAMVDDWSEKAPELRGDVRAIAGDARAAAEDVEDDVDRSQKIAAAARYLEDLLGLLDNVLKG